MFLEIVVIFLFFSQSILLNKNRVKRLILFKYFNKYNRKYKKMNKRIDI